MPIDQVTAARLPLLEGISSFAEAMADAEQRARLDGFVAIDATYVPPPVAVQNLWIPGRHGDVGLRIYTPDVDGAALRPALLCSTAAHSSAATWTWRRLTSSVVSSATSNCQDLWVDHS